MSLAAGTIAAALGGRDAELGRRGLGQPGGVHGQDIHSELREHRDYSGPLLKGLDRDY